MGLFSWVPRFGYKATHSSWFDKLARQTFDEVDVDNDGSLDHKELYIALLKLYDQLNAMLPCHVRVPKLEDINTLMAKYDKDKSGKLQFPEFLSLARALIGTRKDWRQSLVLKVTLAVLLKTAGFPYAGRLIRGGVLSALGKAGLRNNVTEKLLPLGLATFAVEMAARRVYDS